MNLRLRIASVCLAALLSAAVVPPVHAQAPGSPCAPENLINGFIVLGRDDPFPNCPVRTMSTALPTVYRLQLPSRFRETVFSDRVTYDVPGPNNLQFQTAVSITLSRTFNAPEVLGLREVSQASAADYLPRPGVVIDSHNAVWVEPAGVYQISIDEELAGLTIEQVVTVLYAEEPRELGPYPDGTLTGVPHVDAIISAALSADAEALHELLQFVETPCTHVGGIGTTACPEGAEDGDLVGAVTIGDCEGGGATEIPMDTLVDFLRDTRFLYAVLRNPAPNAPFVVIFGQNEFGAEGRGLTIGDRGVTGIFYGCAQSATALAEFWDVSLPPLLPLRLETPPGPPATGSGLSASDGTALRRLPLFASVTALAFAAAALAAHGARTR